MEFHERPAEGGTVEVDLSSGKSLVCLVCGHNRFHERNALLNTRLNTFFKLDWTDRQATNFVCAACGYVHWFLPEPGK
jgi:predicted nucleic-acid-binding Zn-ribbon protein